VVLVGTSLSATRLNALGILAKLDKMGSGGWDQLMGLAEESYICSGKMVNKDAVDLTRKHIQISSMSPGTLTK
jgi:hypothetical protein